MIDDDEARDPRDAAIEATWRALPVDRPPAGFADRVQARLHAARRRRRALTAAALAAAALITALLWPERDGEGTLEATARTTIPLAARAVAVAEAGAALRWRIDGATLRVAQPEGRVFYRVDAGPLIVTTPAGDIAVRGTCFTVEVSPMSPRLKAAALGALAGAAVTVAVYEGSVTLQNEHGEARLTAGEHGHLDRDAPPRRVDPDRLAAPPAPPEPPAPPAPPRVVAIAPRAPAPPDPPAEPPPELRAELEALRAELTDLRRDLADERAMRLETEGQPIPFPPELDDRFREAALRQTFAAALAESGLDGEIKSIDCSEFPCVVYGDVANDDGRALDHLSATEAMGHYKDAANNTSAWGQRLREGEGEEARRTFFGIALMPKDFTEDPARREQLGKRLRFRNDQTFDAFRPDEEPPPE